MNSKTNPGQQKIAYSIAEAAELLGVSPGHLRNENQRGKLRFIKSGRRILITDMDLRRYLEEQIIEPTSPEVYESSTSKKDR